MKEVIKRINELAAKAKTPEGLNAEELAERDKLRRIYIDSYKASLVGQLENTYIVYPDARSSIRFERLIEGIQDAEKIRVLRKQYNNENSAESLAKLNELEETIKYFNTLEPSNDWIDKLNEAKLLLNK